MITDQDLDDAHADSKPLLEWRENNLQVRPDEAYEIRAGELMLTAKRKGEDWWLGFVLSGGEWVSLAMPAADAKSHAVAVTIESLERVLSELKRGVA